MEEIDNIIIESLKHLKCKIDDDVKSIKSFDSDMVVDAIVSCLEVITPGINMPHKLSPSMSLRLKVATALSENIKELGFRGDIGYQTILYCNEVEVRRLLMFLIERLPRESDDIPVQETGYVHNLVRKIENKIKLHLQKSWVPSSFLRLGVRDCGSDFLKSSYRNTTPLITENIQIPSTQSDVPEDVRQYWIYHLEDVTKQCTSANLIPSLLFKDSDFSNIYVDADKVTQNLYESNTLEEIKSVVVNKIEPSALNKIEDVSIMPNNNNNSYENKILMFSQNIEQEKLNILKLKNDIKAEKSRLLQISEEKNQEEASLKDMITKFKIKSRTLTVLSKEENLEKLKNLVQNGNERFLEMENQWKEVQTPLVEEYATLISNFSAVETKHQEEQDRLKCISEKKQQLLDELKSKEKLEKLLKQERERLSKNTRRSAYTRRILEIIGNIKKQNEEIQKILNDTKVVQKKINSLNGQLDRSFTLSDELIFRNAKQDEMSRKAYKLLAALHNDCGIIIQAITEIGVTEREARNLQEQIDTEVSKATGTSLERVNADLENVKKETASLLKQTHV